jgi:mRNA interferase ChpB
MPYTPERGDIVHLQFDPALGKEMKGPHYGLIISGRPFNLSGLAMICPISQGKAEIARTYGTVVTLYGTGIDTQGAIHCHQLKSMDWKIRQAKLKERVPVFVMDEVEARLQAILFT